MQTLMTSRASTATQVPTEILRCPNSNDTLRAVSAAELDELNMRFRQGMLRHQDGSRVEHALTRALKTESSRFVYRIDDGIIILLSSLAIVADKPLGSACELRREKQSAKRFYDEEGWNKNESEHFVDAGKFEDLRDVSTEYIHKCHLRINRHLKSGGKYLLDVASGPVQYPEYQTYSENYARRVCVDISLRALKEARVNLGDHGVYILGDITNLPLKDDTVDGAVSLHTIYHVPADEQTSAFLEVARVLRPGSSAAVVYCWKPSLALKIIGIPASLARLPMKIARMFGKRTNRKTSRQTAASSVSSKQDKLYYHAHDFSWFCKQSWEIETEVHSWRSISVPLMRSYIHPWFFGRQVLRAIYWLEERMPRLFGRVGAYPIIVLRKT